MVTAYSIACGVSISIAMSMRLAANKMLAGKTGFAVAIAGNVINYAAVMASTNANVFKRNKFQGIKNSFCSVWSKFLRYILLVKEATSMPKKVCSSPAPDLFGVILGSLWSHFAHFGVTLGI